MVCKPINQINFKLEEMFDAIVWVIMTVRQASVFDANNFSHHISQLTVPDTADYREYFPSRTF